MTIRFYSSVAAETTLTSAITNASTIIQVGSTTGLPANTPYTLAVDYEGATEELVEVTNVAGTSLTVTRAIDGTSAASHNTGARVRHVSSARDFSDSRTHENSSTSIHGLAPGVNIVGDTSTQSLTNKTLVSPVINGTITGNPTISGNIGGNPVFTGDPRFQQAAATTEAFNVQVTGDTVPRLSARADGRLSWGPGNAAADTVLYRPANGVLQTEDEFRSLRAATTDGVISGRVGADTQNRVTVFANGDTKWGPGNAAADVTLRRLGSATLQVDGGFNVSGTFQAISAAVFTSDATVQGNLAVTGIGGVRAVRKSSDTSRPSTITVTSDPELALTLPAIGTYIITGQCFFAPNSAGADCQIAFGGTASGNLNWSGAGAHNSLTTGSAAQGEWIARVGSSTPIPFGNSQTAGVETGIIFSGTFQASSAGTIELQWAQQNSSATATILRTGSWLRYERIA